MVIHKIVDHQPALISQATDGLLELGQGWPARIAIPGKHTSSMPDMMSTSVLDELRRNSLADALNNNLRLYHFLGAELAVAASETSAFRNHRSSQERSSGHEDRNRSELAWRKLGRTLVKERHRLLRELLSLVEALGVQHDLGDELLVGL